MRKTTIFLVFAWAVLLGGSPANAVSTDRGAWFFDTADPLGSGNVVGNVIKENGIIQTLNRWNIARIYDSFQNPVPPPSATDLAAWHVRLNTNSVTPMLLLSDATATADLTFFTDQLINFNSGRPANEKYQGVKLDLEPQASVAWNGSDLSLAAAINRRDMLNTLRDTYASIRTHLDSNGEAGTPIFADLPVWFDNTDGFIGWGEGVPETAAVERDNWFANIATNLTGITMMAFGTSFFASIESNVNWEINNFASDVRVALEVSIGGGNTWPDFPALRDMMDQVEDFYAIPANNPSGHSIGIDIQDLTQFFYATAPEPLTALLSLVSLGALGSSLRRRVCM